ncbi:hypothetical protein I5M27_05325 [Adhaeribacter sp. BT258]|uniref:Cytochrome C and Quinol oxidase polypeptide I n=1 Tax=Adhaeribacter terrigena TaxID=2793070 RepID=A0ABS1C1H5_9BACT|nr:hypothetical protein [Adhaeribacter terrigena]MBK0402395.1 hypothetical protein [Adhaeribacter terrigena]
MKPAWLKIAFLNLLVVAMLGLFLRWQFVQPTEGVNFKNFLHAHSHVALLGWLYSAFFIAFLPSYLPENLSRKKSYRWLFYLAQASVLGMLICFPIQGYAMFSITFSTLHILFSYGFIYRFLKDCKQSDLVKNQHQFSFKFIKAALFFLALSSLGPWAMGPIMATGNSFTQLYYNAIYFYLHFQYNGWFSFAALSLFFWLLEHYQITFNRQKATVFFRLLFWACLPAYLLSILWIKPDFWVYLIAGISALVQLIALALFGRISLAFWPQLSDKLGFWSRSLMLLAFTAFALKILLQAVSAIPYFADLIYNIRHFIIGYLHLVLIGFISLFLFSWFLQMGWISMKNRMAKIGLVVFLLAFLLTEALLFLQGVFYWAKLGMIPDYDWWMFALSISLPVGLGLFILNISYQKKLTTKL